MSKAKCSSENPTTCRYHGHDAQVALVKEQKQKAEASKDLGSYLKAKQTLESLEKLRQSKVAESTRRKTGKDVPFVEYNKALETADNFRAQAALRAVEHITTRGTDRGVFDVNQSDGSKGGYYVTFNENHNFEARGYERTVPVTLSPWNRAGQAEKVNLPADAIQGNSESKANGKSERSNIVTFSRYRKALETTDNFRHEAARRAATYVSSHTTFDVNQSDGSKGGYYVAFNEDQSFEERGYERMVPVTLHPWNPAEGAKHIAIPADIIQGK